MGTLVFQATLGGAVNIIGPNIANTINFTLPSADGTSGQTWTTNGSGVLAFGTLGIAGGGTGQITATAAFNALAPSQSGQSGKYLTTDGTNTSWGTNPLGTVTSVGGTGTVNGLTLTGTVTTSGNLTLGGTLSGVANSALTNSSITIGGTAIALGASSNALANDITVFGATVGRGGGVSTNTAVGASALQASNSGTGRNSIVGYQAAYTNTTGFALSAVGYQAAYTQLDGNYNSAYGHQALFTNSSGSSNVAIGSTALYTNTGSNNVAVGRSALESNTSASNNTAVGYQSGYSNTIGSNSSYFGYQSGYANIDGTYNLGIGRAALAQATNSNNNIAIGYFALGGITTTATSLNTAVGNESGSAITTGSKNSILGAFTGNQDSLDIRTASNYVVLSDGDGNRQITMKEGQTLALDSAVPNSGTGITFPATQSASSNANTLDDYEEGTWTPAVTFGGGATGVTYGGSNGGTYTKVGRIVTVCGILDLTSKGSSTGNISITGLPFSGSNFGGAALTLYGLTFTGQAYGQPNGSAMVLFQILAGTRTVLTDTAFANDTSIGIQITYFV